MSTTEWEEVHRVIPSIVHHPSRQSLLPPSPCLFLAPNPGLTLGGGALCAVVGGGVPEVHSPLPRAQRQRPFCVRDRLCGNFSEAKVVPSPKMWVF